MAGRMATIENNATQPAGAGAWLSLAKKKKKGKKEKKKITVEIVATNVVASRPPNGDRLQRRPLVPIQTDLNEPIKKNRWPERLVYI